VSEAKRLIVLLLALSGLAGCGAQPDEEPLFLVGREAAESLGAQHYAAEIEAARQANALDNDPTQVALVAGIAERLIAEAKRLYPISQDWHWEIHVLHSPAVNAYCAPGGKIVVLSGLLQAAAMDPNRIANVVGHEIAHALLEHARANLSRDWLLISGMWIVSKSLKMGAVRTQSAIEGLNTILLPMSREHEREADVLGLEIMARAGFEPRIGILFWQDAINRRKAAASGEQRLEAFLSTHPTDAERLVNLRELAARWNPPTAVEAAP
jgi:predicted Zn-dependent protease